MMIILKIRFEMVSIPNLPRAKKKYFTSAYVMMGNVEWFLEWKIFNKTSSKPIRTPIVV